MTPEHLQPELEVCTIMEIVADERHLLHVVHHTVRRVPRILLRDLFPQLFLDLDSEFQWLCVLIEEFGPQRLVYLLNCSVSPRVVRAVIP